MTWFFVGWFGGLAIGFFAGWILGSEHEYRFWQKTARVAEPRVSGWTKRAWDRAYTDAMRWRDWQTCEQLMEESPYPEHQVAGRRDEWGS